MAEAGQHVFIDIETTGLYPIVHRIVCVGLARGPDARTLIDRDERKILRELLDSLGLGDILVGFNLGFDLGFLVLRCMKHGLDPVRLLSCERVDLLESIADLLTVRRVSLQALADFFGIEYEPTSGKLIPEQWEAGDFDSIRHHCLTDLRLTAELHERLKPLLREPATPRQLAYLRSLGVEFPEGITKEEASKLIDKAIRGG